jgi:predicted nucleotidyltransferase
LNSEGLLKNLVEAAVSSFKEDLKSIVLFGSGAEGQLRATSDLNLMFVLGNINKDRLDTFREPLRLAHIAGRVAAMFILESELPMAAESFAVKFDDIGRRHRILYGKDVIGSLTISRQAKKQRLCQVLINLILRLRERYAMVSLHEEQLALVIAQTAGPLRSAAATFLELQGQQVISPKEALELFVKNQNNADWASSLEYLSQVRQSAALPPGAAAGVIFNLIAIAASIHSQAQGLH